MAAVTIFGLGTAALSAAVGAICHSSANKSAEKQKIFHETKKMTVGEIQSALRAQGGLTGMPSLYGKLQGQTSSDNPVTVNSRSVCMSLKQTIQVRDDWVSVSSTNPQGHTSVGWRQERREHVLADAMNGGPLKLIDGSSGRETTGVYTSPTVRVHDLMIKDSERFEANTATQVNVNVNTGNNNNGQQPASQVLGHRVVEKIIPFNQKVYALGEFYMDEGNVFFRQKLGQPFVFEYGTEYDILHRESENERSLRTGAYVFFGIGGASLVGTAAYHFFSR